MRFCTCLPFCRGSTAKDDPEPPPKDVAENRRSLESLRPEPVVSLTTKNEGITSGEDEFGIGGVQSPTGDSKSGLIRAGGVGVIGNVSMDHGTHKEDEYGGRGRDYGEGHKGGQDMKSSISAGNETTVLKRASTREGNNSTQREHEINMEQIINCGEDSDAEKHLKTIHRQQFWKKPFRSVSLRNLISLKWKGKRPTETKSEYPPKVERFSIEDGRISREVTELV